MPSVIIPAHNESALIAQCVSSVLQDGVEDLDVIVVANACQDNTVEIARSVSPLVRVLETGKPGKTNALNLGESATKKFPRVFLDGDIVLQPGSLRALLETLGGPIQLASPPPTFVLEQSSWLVRCFYSALEFNDYFGRGAPNGSGTFALTAEGRHRWKEFPEIVADDGFVGMQFAAHEKTTSVGPGAFVRVPLDLHTLVRIKARSRLGTRELFEKFPYLLQNNKQTGRSTIGRLLQRPHRLPELFVYLYVRVAERAMEKKLACSKGQKWLRDETSRAPNASANRS